MPFARPIAALSRLKSVPENAREEIVAEKAGKL